MVLAQRIIGQDDRLEHTDVGHVDRVGIAAAVQVYDRSADRVPIEIDAVIVAVFIGRRRHNRLVAVVGVQVVVQLRPEHELVVLERDKTRYLQLPAEVVLHLLVTNVVQLNADESGALAHHQIAQVVTELLVVPLVYEILVREHEQNDRAVRHGRFGVVRVDLVRVVLVVVENVVLDHVVLFRKQEKKIKVILIAILILSVCHNIEKWTGEWVDFIFL